MLEVLSVGELVGLGWFGVLFEIFVGFRVPACLIVILYASLILLQLGSLFSLVLFLPLSTMPLLPAVISIIIPNSPLFLVLVISRTLINILLSLLLYILLLEVVRFLF